MWNFSGSYVPQHAWHLSADVVTEVNVDPMQAPEIVLMKHSRRYHVLRQAHQACMTWATLPWSCICQLDLLWAFHA